MVKRSWFYQNGFFTTMLVLVLLIHIILLAVRISREDKVAQKLPDQSVTGPPIKAKVLSNSEYSAKIKKQIVQSQDPRSFSKPLDAPFLSDKDRQFNRQTLARKIDTFKESGKGKSPKDISLADLSTFNKNHDPIKEGVKALARLRKNETTDGKGASRGISSTNDYVDHIPLGDTTYLNTVEYKYYGFYHRIRQKLEQFWGRSIQEKAAAFLKEGRKIANGDNLITALEVTLNETGEVVGIKVKGTSGVKELDEAAINSFNEAGPFPNPPKGLMQDGLVKIEWGFVVQTSQNSF